MVEFANIKNVYAPAKKMTETEILRAIKLGIASEFETIQIYQEMIESTDNNDVKIVLTDITHDEMHHAGALYKLLEILSPENSEQYAHGAQKALSELGK